MKRTGMIVAACAVTGAMSAAVMSDIIITGVVANHYRTTILTAHAM